MTRTPATEHTPWCSDEPDHAAEDGCWFGLEYTEVGTADAPRHNFGVGARSAVPAESIEVAVAIHVHTADHSNEVDVRMTPAEARAIAAKLLHSASLIDGIETVIVTQIPGGDRA